MPLQLAMSMARNIIAVVILIRPHSRLTLSPEPLFYVPRRQPCRDIIVLLLLQTVVRQERNAVLAFALSLRYDLGVQCLKVFRELLQLLGPFALCVLDFDLLDDSARAVAIALVFSCGSASGRGQWPLPLGWEFCS